MVWFAGTVPDPSILLFPLGHHRGSRGIVYMKGLLIIGVY